MAEQSSQIVSLSRTRSDESSQLGVPAPLPLTLYVHLPWCLKKCPYCDFNSHEQPAAGLDQSTYVDALLSDLEQALPLIWGRNVQAVFLGGGTPSLFEPAAIERLISGIRARTRLVADAEITLEANPGTFESERFVGFRQAGVTRLSIGVQSFNDAALAALGRVHSADQAHKALRVAADHYDTFNLDLMFALPGQSMSALREDLAHVQAFRPPHFSCYHLTIEPNTLFASRPPSGLPDDDLAADMLDVVVDCASAIGLRRYEVSAYAADGHRCRHNLNYWQFGDYLGIGAGAHSKLSFPDRIIRQQRYRHPRRYLEMVRAGDAVELTRELSALDLPFEFMLNALRLVDGVPTSLFYAHTGMNLATIGELISQAAADGLMVDADRLAATPHGLQFLNELQARFLADESA